MWLLIYCKEICKLLYSIKINNKPHHLHRHHHCQRDKEILKVKVKFIQKWQRNYKKECYQLLNRMRIIFINLLHLKNLVSLLMLFFRIIMMRDCVRITSISCLGRGRDRGRGKVGLLMGSKGEMGERERKWSIIDWRS